MKVFILAVFGVMVYSSVFAAELKGKVEAVNAPQNQIIVVDSVTGQKHFIEVHPNVIGSLSAGSVVNVEIQSGSNRAETISVEME